MAADPYERNDVASQNPDVTAELIGAWNEYAEEVGVVTGD